MNSNPVFRVLLGRRWLPLDLLRISSTKDFLMATILIVAEYFPVNFQLDLQRDPQLPCTCVLSHEMNRIIYQLRFYFLLLLSDCVTLLAKQ